MTRSRPSHPLDSVVEPKPRGKGGFRPEPATGDWPCQPPATQAHDRAVATQPQAPSPKGPLWRNPFLIAFVLGAVVLTVLPFMQRRFLRAPPPGPNLGTWALQTADGGTVGANELKGKVWLASFASTPVRRTEFGTVLKHTDDLGDAVVLVSFVPPGTTGPAGGARWFVLSGSPQAFEELALRHFQPAYAQFARTDAGSTLAEWAEVPTMGLVDQNGALRGFWHDNDLGRGNAINAARLLAKQGPNP